MSAPVEDLVAWMDGVPMRVATFLRTLQDGSGAGRYRPCRDGLTADGRRAKLGFSCFALKTLYALGSWPSLPETSRRAWTDFIVSFQRRGFACPFRWRTGFVDWAVIEGLNRNLPPSVRWRERLRRYWLGRLGPNLLDKVVLAETKQAIATLAQVGEWPPLVYDRLPLDRCDVRAFLLGQDWTHPWEAGGQASGVATLLSAQRESLKSCGDVDGARAACAEFFREIVDQGTGGYFLGPAPAHGELINGAMKVLTALDWLGEDVHNPERLIDTCLASLPAPNGCHIVDAVYVLYRCCRQTTHRRSEVITYTAKTVEMIRAHERSDGGFSFDPSGSAQSYYGLPVSEGRPVGDVHGTCLLVWALAMVRALMGFPQGGWRIIRP